MSLLALFVKCLFHLSFSLFFLPSFLFFILFYFFTFFKLYLSTQYTQRKRLYLFLFTFLLSVWRPEASFLRYISFLISYKQRYSFINRCELFVLFTTLLNNSFLTIQLQRHEFQNEKLTSCSLFSIFRSICQNMAVLRQHEGGEEEDEHQNALAQPCLQ